MHNKTYDKTFATSEDTDKPAPLLSLISPRRAFYSLWTIHGGINKNPCHTGWMYRLIWVLAGLRGLIVGFVLHWFILVYKECPDECFFFYFSMKTYSRTSMAWTSLGPLKFVWDMGSSSHWELIKAPAQEANSNNLGIFFSIFYKIICWVYSLELPPWCNSNKYNQHTIYCVVIRIAYMRWF